jgi:4-amino-4-deoxy-L-arabinose transferase-like glycosyltransferase
MMGGRFWVGLVLLLFCLPLFVGLGNNDLIGDEAAHSFSVDRILETGDWLVPRSSPNEEFAFVEKPPLKFWIVAAPIRLGLLPLNEFSLRFWDALFGSIAFLYIFAIGGRMAGPVCGAVAVLVCFTYAPLLFDHGLRGNNMEATLLLSYCGGVYHYLRWAAASDTRSSRRHAFAVALYFVLGFLTKFVAVLFLPAVLLAGTLLIGAARRKAVRDWPLWAAASALALALGAPWFVFATLKFGRPFWDEILIHQVFTRLTAYLDPSHLQPWSFYWMTLYKGFLYSGSYLLVLGGLLLLFVDTIRRRWVEGTIVLLWFVLPVAAISMGTSKIIHYAYPYLPPLALCAGYLAAVALAVLPAPLDRALWAPNQYAAGWMPRTIAALRRPAGRKVLITIGATAVAIAIATLAYGQIRLSVGDHVFFKNSGVLRPALVAILCGVLVGESRRAARAVVPLLVAGLLPLPAYRDLLGRLNEVGDHRMRSARDCILRTAARDGAGSSPGGMYVSGLNNPGFGHAHYYYFRKIRPWERGDPPSFAKILQYSYDPAHPKPVLLQDATYKAFMHWAASPERPVSNSVATSPPRIVFGDVVLVLPGPYARCLQEVSLAGPR